MENENIQTFKTNSFEKFKRFSVNKFKQLKKPWNWHQWQKDENKEWKIRQKNEVKLKQTVTSFGASDKVHEVDSILEKTVCFKKEEREGAIIWVLIGFDKIYNFLTVHFLPSDITQWM